MASIMVQGTTSYAGKSFLVMALCRIFHKKGIRAAPFKSQNMSLNSSVTGDGKEIARAQVLQALAAGVEPQTEMNPILIKPTGDSKSQIVVLGRPYRDTSAENYYRDFAKTDGKKIIKEAFKTLDEKFELVIIEGAGSPAEINLYDQDIANMHVADMADAPVILVADIDRGGVFASIYGTLALLKMEHRERVRGIVINKFRGNIDLLKPGIKQVEELTGKPVLGVIPYIEGLRLPGEDSMSISSSKGHKGGTKIAVIRLPRISNFTDFDPLINEGVEIKFAEEPGDLNGASAVIIPGTKNTTDDLRWLREQGFEKAIKDRTGKVPVIGICGGYQMLGKSILEKGQEIEGLGLLDVKTIFKGYKKTTKQASGRVVSAKGIFKGAEGTEVAGYEIHMGQTVLGKKTGPVFELEGHTDGAVDETGTVFGTYFHGVFDSASFREVFLGHIGAGTEKDQKTQEEIWNESIEKAAKIVEDSIDVGRIEEFIND